MENKITLPKLVTLLALATGKQKKLCEDFLRELFKIIGDELTAGENVRIKGFGTFKLVDVEPRKSVNVATGEENEIPGHAKIIFVPARELAALANAAFDAFEAVEIADDLPVDALDGDVSVDDYDSVPPHEEEEVAEIISAPDKEIHDDDSVDSPDEEPVTEEQPEPESKVSESSEESFKEELSEEESSQEDENIETPPSRFKQRFWWGVAAGFAIAALLKGLFLLLNHWYGFYDVSGRQNNNETMVEMVAAQEKPDDKTLLESDSAEVMSDTVVATVAEKMDSNEDEVPTRPSDAVVYDTVSTTRYLTTMAKEHYGNFNLWPLIYEENKAILGHPDRIKPGTQVVIPPLSKYGVDPKNPAHIKEAKRKGRQIYSRYK